MFAKGLIAASAAASISVLMMTGCTARMQVTDRANGVPFRTMVMTQLRHTDYFQPTRPLPDHVHINTCSTQVSTENKMLPLGPTAYLKFKMPWIGKGKAGAKFSENGVMTELSLNSDGTALPRELAALATAALPYLATTEIVGAILKPVNDIASKIPDVPGDREGPGATRQSAPAASDMSAYKKYLAIEYAFMRIELDEKLNAQQLREKYCTRTRRDTTHHIMN